MNKTTIVAFLLLTSNTLFANSITSEINAIESEWANIYYNKNKATNPSNYQALLTKTQQLSKSHYKATGFIIWQAIIISSNAAHQPPFTALESINTAKTLLESAIQEHPAALDGAAFTILGTLYYMTPGWPISFGNNKKAETLLKKGLKINPKSIDANYFYASYLLSIDKLNEAVKFFKLALNQPARANQTFADQQLQKEAHIALLDTYSRIRTSRSINFIALFSSQQIAQDNFFIKKLSKIYTHI